MKRLLTLFFAFALIFSLAACSGNDDKDPATEQPPVEENAGEANKEPNKPIEKAEEVELTISAAASLTDAFEEVKQAFQKEHENLKINFNFAASGDLQQQISNGAPVDFFISAALDKFETLLSEGAIEENQHKDFLQNELVLILPADSTADVTSFADLTADEIGKIAVGTPESVPVGKYSKQSLEHLGIWEELADKIIFAKDVREVLNYVDTGNVDAGFVYKTDAATSEKSKIVATAEDGYHERVIYPAGVIKDSKHKEEAIIFYEFLQSDLAVNILEAHGFKVLD